jgi:FkbM family methyltransferase
VLSAGSRSRHPELWELFLEEVRMPLVLQKVLQHDSCAVDVGGHVGSFLSLLIKYAPAGQHTVFEPSLTKSQWLRRRFPDVRVFSCAVANEAGAAVFEEDYARPGFSALQRGSREPAANINRYKVETCRLDDVLFEMGRIDLIKLDIEGGELAALHGAVKIIEKWNPVIIFECGPEHWLAERKLNRMALYKLVTEDLGYNILCFADFLFNKGEMGYDEFRKCGIYPFRALNFIALPRSPRS